MSANGPCRLNPGTALGWSELLIRGRIARAVARTRSATAAREVGASVVEWVIITALLVGMAVTVGAILLSTVEEKANEIDLNTDTAP